MPSPERDTPAHLQRCYKPLPMFCLLRGRVHPREPLTGNERTGINSGHLVGPSRQAHLVCPAHHKEVVEQYVRVFGQKLFP